MNYTKTEWEDAPSTNTPITSARLNNMEDGIEYLFTNGVGIALPIGSITQYAGSTAPSGFLICDGSAISRTTYSDLFSIIGTTYGSGDETTTFNLPNLKGKIPVGYDNSDTNFDTLGETGGEKEHTLTTDEIPNHSHRQLYANSPSSGSWGRDINGVSYKIIASPSEVYNGIFTDETGGGQAHNNLQPYVVVNYIIKY